MEEIRTCTPNIEQIRMMDALRFRGMYVQGRRVCIKLRQIDSIDTALHWAHTLYRRKYSAPISNSI